jgi:hypothetical protein
MNTVGHSPKNDDKMNNPLLERCPLCYSFLYSGDHGLGICRGGKHRTQKELMEYLRTK